jgi:Peptidase family C54
MDSVKYQESAGILQRTLANVYDAARTNIALPLSHLWHGKTVVLQDSAILMTYRSGIQESIAGKFSSDAGWGCMMRSGQMLLANTLLRHALLNGSGSDEVYANVVTNTNFAYRRLFRFFSTHHLRRFQSTISSTQESLMERKLVNGWAHTLLQVF